LVHAFTASKNEKAVMFVGPSGSGKTSSGLSLVAAGWHFLANDMALVRQSNATLALLSPGTVQVSPSTISLLPQFSGLLTRYPKKPGKRKISVPRSGIFQKNEKVQSAEVRFILFPTVKGTQEHQVKAVPRAVGLARLMKSSMDQWDKETWKTHVRFLEQLSYQVDFYDLELGKDMAKLPQCLGSVFAEH
jgi:hypothetical protein